MANTQSTLPEGADSIISDSDAMMDDAPGNDGFTNDDTFASAAASASKQDGVSAAKAELGDAAAKAGDAAAGLRAQAADKARDYALQGKDRAVGALENVTRLVDDAAATIDEKVGEQYGDYARRASEYVAGFADTLRDKDVDELFDDAREVVRKSPAIAIGAAAAIGFVLARLVKAGIPAEEGASATDASTAAKVSDAPKKSTPSTATTVPADHL
jgi:ElaB/YqjD/DUF883 family membrane-anchored ribosome-binding protein